MDLKGGTRNLACVRACRRVLSLFLCVLIIFAWYGTTLADSAYENNLPPDAASDDLSIRLDARQNQKPLDTSTMVPDIQPREKGSVFIKEPDDQQFVSKEETLPLSLDTLGEVPQAAHHPLPRDTNIDTLRGYTTSHTLPNSGRLRPSPGLLMVHDADRKEEEQLFFGVLSLTIQW
jgi:hypothetical protein